MKKEDLIIDKVVSFRFYGKCPSCNGEYDLVKDKLGFETNPRYCPHCGIDINKEKTTKRRREIEQNEYCQLHYDVIGADLNYGINEHPQTQMKNLGYKVIGSVPQMIADCWWFTVENFIEPLPPYLSKMKYNYKYWHENCWKDCEYFKEHSNGCFGGSSCKKDT